MHSSVRLKHPNNCTKGLASAYPLNRLVCTNLLGRNSLKSQDNLHLCSRVIMAEKMARFVSEDNVGRLHVSSFVLVKKGTSILLEKMAKDAPFRADKWALPAGILVRGEHPDDGARRILGSDLGVDPGKIRFRQIQSHYDEDHWDLCFVYESESLENYKPRKGVANIEFFPLSGLPNDLAPDHREVIDALR